MSIYIVGASENMSEMRVVGGGTLGRWWGVEVWWGREACPQPHAPSTRGAAG